MTPHRIEHRRCHAPTCRAELVWAYSAQTGKRIPLDAEPLTLGQALEDPGHVYYLDTTHAGRAIKWTPAIVHDVGDLHRSHFRTCADVDRFRR